MEGRDTNKNAEEHLSGLTAQQVDERRQKGLINKCNINTTKTYGQIIKDNLFTFFNVINAILCVMLISVGAYKDLMFMMIVVANLLIGIIQEISSKKTLDRLAVIVAAKARVVRGGKEQSIPVDEIVLDDVLRLKSGEQVCSDAVVLEGRLEVNESLITGESDVIVKQPGDALCSGSFVVAGSAYTRVTHVGSENYANQISMSAKKMRRKHSELRSSVSRILKVISAFIVPVGIALYVKHYLFLQMGAEQSIVKTVAAVIGMIPEGLVLLVSVALTTSAIILAVTRRTLVQDMYCTETLARVDVLCLDKTGTLTNGDLRVTEIIPLLGSMEDAEEMLAGYCSASEDDNATMCALIEHCRPQQAYAALSAVPFSSARKYGAVQLEEKGTYFFGAAEFLFPQSEEKLKETAAKHAKNGSRALVLAKSEGNAQIPLTERTLTPVALVLMADSIRDEAKETLAYFEKQDIKIKIISGDNPYTVKNIAAKAGFSGKTDVCDASLLHTDEDVKRAALRYDLFGRVSPGQKQLMVEALRENGHTVGMMGDGVNDVLALKEADLSVAVAEGSDAAKNISSLVLLDSNFDALPAVLNEGRKVINNVERAATLFITKTVYSMLLSIATLFIFGNGYPFTPLQLWFISVIVIGAPSFILALEPNYSRVEGGFLRNVLRRSLPGGLAIFLGLLLIDRLAGPVGYGVGMIPAMSFILVVAAGIMIVFLVSVPLTRTRKILLVCLVGAFAFSLAFLRGPFDIPDIDGRALVSTLLIVALMPVLMKFFSWILQKYFQYSDAKKAGKVASKANFDSN
ncbi:MAG: HAD-IC family P-type ATPase [Christensenellaceae bacterium]|jgi:cation-transporting ATPase E